MSDKILNRRSDVLNNVFVVVNLLHCNMLYNKINKLTMNRII